jgi:dihydrofolate reductase
VARLVFGMNQSLDGYIDHEAFGPDHELFRHFIDQARASAGSVYGRRLYEVMRYWDDDDPTWTADLREFADAWRRQPKWVVSRTLPSVGPNATLIRDDVESAVRKLKDDLDGEIEVGGPELAHSLAGLIDAYQIYLHPVVLGQGKPFFFGARPPLRLVAHEPIGNAIRLTYEPGPPG